MTAGRNDLRKVVRLNTVGGTEHAVGVMIGYLPAPSITIETAPGVHVHWAANLVTVLDAQEAAEYWERRAIAAETALQEEIRIAPDGPPNIEDGG